MPARRVCQRLNERWNCRDNVEIAARAIDARRRNPHGNRKPPEVNRRRHPFDRG